MDNIDSVLDKLAAIPDIPMDKRGIEYHSKCPCGGDMKSWRAMGSGHLRASCEKCGWRLIE